MRSRSDPLRLDLHTHTTLSDGELIPAELVRRAVATGHCAVAITDHVDPATVEMVLTALSKLHPELEEEAGIAVLRGVEITHVPPRLIPKVAAKARQLGADLVLVHGETLVEPVQPGTNAAASRCDDVDMLVHPGLVSRKDARLCAERGISLEITTRKGHSLSNGHVARVAGEAGCILVVNTDAHTPGDLVSHEFAQRVAIASGLARREAEDAVNHNPRLILKRALELRRREAAVGGR